MSKPGEELIINIHEQGAVVVNEGYVMVQHDDVVLIEVDLHTKYADVSLWISGNTNTGPGIMLEATERTLHKHEEKQGTTTIYFPQFGDEWRVFGAHVGRYTLSITLSNPKVIRTNLEEW